MLMVHELPGKPAKIKKNPLDLSLHTLPGVRGGKVSHVLIVGDKTTERDCIARTISDTSKNLHVTACTVHTMNQVSGAPDLVLFFINLQQPDSDSILEKFKSNRLVVNEVPFVVITNEDHVVSFSAELFKLGASGCISDATGLEGLKNVIWLVLNGGACFPRESLRCQNAAEYDAHCGDICAAEATKNNDTLVQDAPDLDALLTKRESEVVQKLQLGKPNKIIAYELGISISTVKVHLRNIMRKTGATNRVEAALRSGISGGCHPVNYLSVQR